MKALRRRLSSLMRTRTDSPTCRPLGAKVDFLEGCAAVFVMAIGASAIKQLVARGIRPIRITESDKIEDLLYDIAQGMKHGGVAWIDQAMAEHARPVRSADRFAAMQEEGWEG